MHGNMLTMNGKKMSKSTGNNILPNEIFSGANKNISKAYTASATRFFMMQAHYRSILDFSDNAILASEKGYNRLMEAVSLIDNLKPSSISSLDIKKWKQQCYDAMNDDFNTPILIANLFEAVKFINLINDRKESLTIEDLNEFKTTIYAFVYDVLGLENSNESNDNSSKLVGVVEILIQLRKEARENKDWALSDKIRNELIALGIQLKDGKDGTIFSVG